MMKVFLIQLKKLWKRNDIRVAFAVFFILPFLLAVLIATDNSIMEIEGTFTASMYIAATIGIVKMVLLFYVLLVIFTASSIAGDIDSGIEAVMVTRIKSKHAIILSKLGTLYILSALFLIVLFISSLLGWFFFVRGSAYGDMMFFSPTMDASHLILLLVCSMLDNFTMISIFSLISLFFSQTKSIVFGFVVIVLFKVMAGLNTVQDFIPTYIGEGTALNMLADDELIGKGIFSCSLLVLYIIVICILCMIRYSKMDYIKR